MAERWLSVEEVAAPFEANWETISPWSEGKKMPAHKFGQLWKLVTSEVESSVEQGTAGQKET
jgi:hypothetical protein